MNNNVGKWMMPSFLTSLIGMIAIALNDKFLWELDPNKLIASVGLTINFVVMTLSADIAKVKRGEKPSINSTKLATLIIACLLIGFSDYLGITLDEESVWWIAGTAAAFITTRGLRDIVQKKKEEEVPVHEPTQSIPIDNDRV